MQIVMETARLWLIVTWRQIMLAAGRVIWFWIAYKGGMATFDAELPAVLLAAVIAMATLRATITDEEIAGSTQRLTANSRAGG